MSDDRDRFKRDGSQDHLSDDAVNQLRTKLRGQLVVCDDAEARTEPREVWNAMHVDRPAITGRCAGTADVIDAVNFARDRVLLVAVRGGGHSVAGLSTVRDGMLTDPARDSHRFVDGAIDAMGIGTRDNSDWRTQMHAVFVEVNVPDDVAVEDARKRLQEDAAPMVREAGARAGYWLAPQGGRGVSVVVFDSQDEAEKMADQMHVGQAPRNAPPGVTFRTVEVREILASL